MSSVITGFYPKEVEQGMRHFFDSVSEKDRRRYAAVEAQKLGHGGISYLCRIFGCSRELIQHGIVELGNLPDDPAGDRVRSVGGGRKKTEDKIPQIIDQVQDVLANRTAGDPMRQGVHWTDLMPTEITEQLQNRFQVAVSARIVRRILKAIRFGRRKISKSMTRMSVPERNAQFEHIAHLMESFMAVENPVLSIDSKKKEPLGKLHRSGSVYCREAIQAWDHDFANWAEGMVIPHGIYDVQKNTGWLHLGLSRDTSEFASDSFKLYWQQDGQRLYPRATEILIVCDGGGSNGCRTHIFKQDMQSVVNEIGIPIRLAHYPAYCSKFNPIERRLFSHVTRACQGVLFDCLQTVVDLMSKTKTSTGLKVILRVIDKVYEVGRKATDEFKSNMPILFDIDRPQWNYRIKPQTS